MGDFVLVWSMEHGAWWRPGWHGYSTNIMEAGLYARQEAQQIVDGSNGRHEKIVEVPETEWPAGSYGRSLDDSAEAGVIFMQDITRALVSASQELRDAAVHYITKGTVHRGEEERLRAAIARVESLCSEQEESGDAA